MYGISVGRDVGVESFVLIIEFIKVEENELLMDKRILFDLDGEVILMK